MVQMAKLYASFSRLRILDSFPYDSVSRVFNHGSNSDLQPDPREQLRDNYVNILTNRAAVTAGIGPYPAS